MPLNISLSGQTLFQAGNMASPYVMGASGAETFDGFGSSGVSLGRRQTVESIIQAEYPTVYQRGFAGVQQGAIRYADLVNTTLAASRNFTSLSDTDDTLSPLATQLRTVAKMIDRRESLGMSRQIFFVTMGGFDTHDEQNENQPELLGAVSDALKRFNDAMTEINLQDKVTSFTHSDFGRTLSSNGDGSDHAWGGVQLVVGGAVKGQAIYGTYPELRLDSDLDLGGGRFIPTTSADQYVATLAKWFGVDDAYLEEIAPNLKKFTLKDLGFFR